jgi:hypothetical protein
MMAAARTLNWQVPPAAALSEALSGATLISGRSAGRRWMVELELVAWYLDAVEEAGDQIGSLNTQTNTF